MATELTLSLFNQLLVPAGLTPAKDFRESRRLLSEKPPTLETRNIIRFALGSPIHFDVAPADELQRLAGHWRAILAPRLEDEEGQARLDDDDYLRDLATEGPVIRMVNHLLERALDLRASDIHFEPGEESLEVRCRVDGVMSRLEQLPTRAAPAVASRLKLMARLDIGEKRLPQDGRIQFMATGRKLDLRISTLPGIFGESIVLRILNREDLATALEDLGMPAAILSAYQPMIRAPHGIILVTGPTGSGKTTTLYATLEKIYSPAQKIITVEDPVEYQMAGITQVQINPKIGLTFAGGLRSIVRQDPDIIMIGEIRDRETAEIAIESALTGHLVFSTLHTNDAAGAVTRLQEMEIEPYLISSCLLGVMAQRLVRRVCPQCGADRPMTREEAVLLGMKEGPDFKSVPEDAEEISVRRGEGCEKCGRSGYLGRIGLYEFLVVNDDIRDLINRRADTEEIRRLAMASGMRTLRENALEKLQTGLTTPEEIIRVTRAG